MSKFHKQSENMKALEQSLNDHMEICRLKRKVKRFKAENSRVKAEVERLRKAGDWLPIESAPRDGSYFIGGVWGDMESRPTWATMCHYYVSGKRFEMQETCDQPDFWIPLPNAPKEGKPSE